ncbi:hypothetical protein [Corticicoccus populi]|uniref:Uncharacterized protein n=1 Tax=Corticicoccus populi TaxID=1812821 RepID=A0ABW5WV89_9STAP
MIKKKSRNLDNIKVLGFLYEDGGSYTLLLLMIYECYQNLTIQGFKQPYYSMHVDVTEEPVEIEGVEVTIDNAYFTDESAEFAEVDAVKK